jgi:hypothetical protein
MNGNHVFFPTITVSPCSELDGNTTIYINSNNQISIDWFTESKGNLLAELFTVEGKLIANESFYYSEGINQHTLNIKPATGIYLIQLTTDNQIFSQKIFIK